jgi:uncharacterized membrane protein
MRALIDAPPLDTLLLVHALATWWMAGVIWMVQLVHYPLMALVSEARWREYEAQHRRRITFVVMPAMLIELATACWIAARQLAGDGPAWSGLVGLALVLALWLSTFLVQTPLHMRLSQRFDADDHARLVRSNWLRTLLWSARAVLALLLLT